MKGYSPKAVNEVRKAMPNRLKKRFADIKSWLNLSNETLEAWLQLAFGMNDWVYNALRNNKIQTSELANQFPVLWERYLAETKRNDVVVVTHGVDKPLM